VLSNQVFSFGARTAYPEPINLQELNMTPSNDVLKLQTATFLDSEENSDRAATDPEGTAGSFEPQSLTRWPTLRMTATWGN
jgi:hypothetical protein